MQEIKNQKKQLNQNMLRDTMLYMNENELLIYWHRYQI